MEPFTVRQPSQAPPEANTHRTACGRWALGCEWREKASPFPSSLQSWMLSNKEKQVSLHFPCWDNKSQPLLSSIQGRTDELPQPLISWWQSLVVVIQSLSCPYRWGHSLKPAGPPAVGRYRKNKWSFTVYIYQHIFKWLAEKFQFQLFQSVNQELAIHWNERVVATKRLWF